MHVDQGGGGKGKRLARHNSNLERFGLKVVSPHQRLMNPDTATHSRQPQPQRGTTRDAAVHARTFVSSQLESKPCSIASMRLEQGVPLARSRRVAACLV
jgi:hypothetical protein